MDDKGKMNRESEVKRCGENPLCGGSGNCKTCHIKRITENDKADFSIVSDYNREVLRQYNNGIKTETEEFNCRQDKKREYGLAIDIGTTTLVFQLIVIGTGEVIHTVTSVNSQRKYGYDVLSRIAAATDGKLEALRACVAEDIRNGVELLQKESGVLKEKIRDVVIAGNTTMIHLLKGYDCSGLGAYPFTAVNTDFIREGNTTIFPCISAFVGGDIVSGLYALGFDRKEEISILIDLGTNGEIALGNKDRILVTSTAAGPAFEGGNTGWGTGMIEIAADLLENNHMDETGLLIDEYFENGFPIARTAEGRPVVFTQKDVRILQLAKAAIRTGVDILLDRYGIEEEAVSRVYIAGGFGYFLNIEKAVLIGLLSKEIGKKAEVTGNSALLGGVRYLCDKSGYEAIRKIISISESVVLANDEMFSNIYVENMTFSL